MAMLRSRHLAHGVVAQARIAGDTPGGRALTGGIIYTVPSGFRAIVRDWQLLLGGTAAVGEAVVMPFVEYSASESYWITLWQDSSLNSGGWSKQTDIVLEPGWKLGLSTTGTDLYYHVSGAELSIPA